jgi:thiamine kinase-like enzyme
MSLPVPEDLDELLTPQWLTAALGIRFEGVRVTQVTPGPVIARVCTNARFRIDTEGPMPEGLSQHLCAKGFFGDAFRGHRRAGEPEACFYRDLAPSIDMRTLHCVYADVDPSTRHGVVITDDVVEQGARFLVASDEYTPDQTAESLDELAKLHLATWGAPAYADVPWLAPRLERQLEARGVKEIRGNFEGPIGALVPPEARDAERLARAYAALAAAMHSAQPWAVIHGDPHINNVYLDADGRPSLVDWQLVQRGPALLDVGYHIAASLTVEDRRRVERDLVQHYLDRLTAAGVDPPAWDDAWLEIRRGIVLGFFLWGITLMVDPAITTRMLERLGTAAADHDALESL